MDDACARIEPAGRPTGARPSGYRAGRSAEGQNGVRRLPPLPLPGCSLRCAPLVRRGAPGPVVQNMSCLLWSPVAPAGLTGARVMICGVPLPS